MPRHWLLWLGIVISASSAHAAPIQTIRIDPAKLNSAPSRSLQCAYRLDDLVDDRPAGERAGELGKNQYVLDDAPKVLGDFLLKGGFVDTAEGEGAPVVKVKLARLYITQNLYTRLPVVVYQVSVNEDPPFVIRSQIGSMSWSGREENAYEGYSMAIRDANDRLITALNEHCNK